MQLQPFGAMQAKGYTVRTPQKTLATAQPDTLALRFGNRGNNPTASLGQAIGAVRGIPNAGPLIRILEEWQRSLVLQTTAGRIGGPAPVTWEQLFPPRRGFLSRIAEGVRGGTIPLQAARAAYHGGLDDLTDNFLRNLPRNDSNRLYEMGLYGSVKLLPDLTEQARTAATPEAAIEVYQSLGQMRDNEIGFRTPEEAWAAELAIRELHPVFENAACRIIRDARNEYSTGAFEFLQQYGSGRAVPALLDVWDRNWGTGIPSHDLFELNLNRFRERQAPAMEALLRLTERGVPEALESLYATGSRNGTRARQFAEAMPGLIPWAVGSENVYGANSFFHLAGGWGRNIMQTALTGTLEDLREIGLPEDPAGLRAFAERSGGELQRHDSTPYRLLAFHRALGVMRARNLPGAEEAHRAYLDLLRAEVLEKGLANRGAAEYFDYTDDILLEFLVPALGTPELLPHLTRFAEMFGSRTVKTRLLTERAAQILQSSG